LLAVKASRSMRALSHEGYERKDQTAAYRHCD
jgi:hypothetical protein